VAGHLLAVSAIGADRPGIVAAVTGTLAEVGGNLEDTSMTILRGHFAMTLVVACDRTAEEVEGALAAVGDELGLLVSVREVQESAANGPPGEHHVLTLHGADRPWIVARVSALVAASGGNVTDLVTRLAGPLYVLTMELDLPAGVDAEALAAQLAELAADLGVEASLRPADADLL
jgi:glycine cleavage system transcriptional repressor